MLPSVPSFIQQADIALTVLRAHAGPLRSARVRRPQSASANLLMGGAAGTLAATACYPLDTIRRRMQMKGRTYDGQLHAFRSILANEGLRGFYRGWAANTIKVRRWRCWRAPRAVCAVVWRGVVWACRAAVWNAQSCTRPCTRIEPRHARTSCRCNNATQPPCVQVVPQNAIRLVSYEALKGLLQVKRSRTDT